VSGGESDERVIHDEEIVTIQILLDWGFTKLPQGSPVPMNFEFRMLFFVFGNASEQGSVATRMIPRQPFENNAHVRLTLEKSLSRAGQAAGRFSASKMCSQYKTTSSRWFSTSQASMTRPSPFRFGSSCFSLMVTRVRSVSPIKTGLGKRNLSYP